MTSDSFSNIKLFNTGVTSMKLVDILASRVPQSHLPALAAQTKGEIASVEALKKLSSIIKDSNKDKKNG